MTDFSGYGQRKKGIREGLALQYDWDEARQFWRSITIYKTRHERHRAQVKLSQMGIRARPIPALETPDQRQARKVRALNFRRLHMTPPPSPLLQCPRCKNYGHLRDRPCWTCEQHQKQMVKIYQRITARTAGKT